MKSFSFMSVDLPNGAIRALMAGLAVSLALVMSACTTTTSKSSTPMGQAESIPDVPSSHDRRKAAKTRLDLASNYLRVGRTEVALEEVSNALSLDPGMTDAYMVRAMVYTQMQDLTRAEADYNRVLRERPNDPDVAHNIGFMKCQQSQYAEAQTWFSRALATQGYANRGRTLMAKGLCLQKEGKSHEAIDVLKQAYDFDPANPLVSYNLAALLYGQGDINGAQFYLRRLNGSEYRNAETLWLGIKVENAIGNQNYLQELASVLRNQFPHSKEFSLFERKAFYE